MYMVAGDRVMFEIRGRKLRLRSDAAIRLAGRP